MAEAEKLREAMARGSQAAQQARAQEGGGDVGQSGAEAVAQADDVGETGRGGADGAARPDIEVEAGQGDAASAARPATMEETGGDVQEYLASQAEAEALIPEPPRAEVESVTEEETALRAPGMEGAPVSEPTEAQDEGVVVTVPVQMAQFIVRMKVSTQSRHPQGKGNKLKRKGNKYMTMTITFRILRCLTRNAHSFSTVQM